MDFTIDQLEALYTALLNNKYQFRTFREHVDLHQKEKPTSYAVLRHDVDKRPQNSLRVAQMQHSMAIKGTFYFRAVKNSFDPRIMKEIATMGHEVGYHYETMDTCNGDVDKAYELFCKNLEKFRKVTPVHTISMHGSPMSKYDNRDLWKKYDYKSLGIQGEPYFDMDFNNTFYITDTGRRWDGDRFNIRDRAPADRPITNKEYLNLQFHSTKEIISTIEKGQFPKQVMFNFHPQRWHSNKFQWMKELIIQNTKNQVKQFLK